MKDFRDLRAAMEVLGFKLSEQQTIYKILAAVLHLGNIYFKSVPVSQRDRPRVGGSSGGSRMGASDDQEFSTKQVQMRLEEGDCDHNFIHLILKILKKKDPIFCTTAPSQMPIIHCN